MRHHDNEDAGDAEQTNAADASAFKCPGVDEPCGAWKDEAETFCESCADYDRELEYEARMDEREYMREQGIDLDFADPGGRSALRAETPDNPRDLPCPNCGKPNRLTPADRARGYQCDECADRLERGGY